MADGATGGQVNVNASVDVLQSQSSGLTYSSGSVGKRLLEADFDINVLRPYASKDSPNGYGTLLRDEWKYFDTIVQGVARERLPIVSALIQRSLVMDLPNALGVMNIEWQRVKGDLVDAEVTMSGLPEATKDRMEFESVNMPVPIFHKEFYYNLR
ncbi:hypothetical protein, partial [Parvimonas micra]|uniref:hypothetical protein n=1 Tax=Parvimonas micra TaxID=33033 RepID=UPI002B48BAD4